MARKSEKHNQDKGSATQLVQISLAVAMLMPWADVAYGQFAVDCTRPISFNTIAICGGGGTLQVQPDGDVVTDACVFPLGSVKEALCTVRSFATSGSLQIKLTASTTNISGPGPIKIDSFNIGTDGGGPTKTYVSASLTATPLTFGVGADLVAAGTEVSGTYTGQLTLQVVFTP